MIPALLMIALRIQNEDSLQNWMLLIAAATASCLFSGMGIAIGLLMIVVYGLYVVVRALIVEKKAAIKRIPLWLASIAPTVIFGLGYLSLKG